MFIFIFHIQVEREMKIVKSKIPEVDDGLSRKVVNLVHRIRDLNLTKKPSVRATVGLG